MSALSLPFLLLTLIHHQTTEDTEKLMHLRRHNIRSDFHLCALFSESSVLSLFLKALRAQRKTLCSLWFAVLGGGFWLIALSFSITIPAMAQDEATPAQEPTSPAQDHEETAYRSIRCPAPANPLNLRFECVGMRLDVIKETLTKDFAGYRTALARLGITAIHSYTGQIMGNPSGGQSHGFTNTATLEDLVSWDLYKFLGAPGLSFNVGASYASGRNLSAENIGNVFTVQSAFNGTGKVNLQQMYMQQQLLDGGLTIALGRLAPANLFASLPVFNNYINGGINDVPGSLVINDPIFAESPPGAEWGAQGIYNLTPSVQVAVGLYNTNHFAAAGDDNGVNFAFQQGNKGVLTVTQFSYLYNQAQGATGMPGEYTIGGSYSSDTFSSLSSSGRVSGNYNLYAMFQQMVHRDGAQDSYKGLTVWGEAALSPKQGVSSMPYFLGGGLSYQGLVPGRGNDIVSLGVIYGSFSRYIPQTSGEGVIEADYRIAYTPWFSLTPDLQYVMKPGGSNNIHNAVVLGTQLSITF